MIGEHSRWKISAVGVAGIYGDRTKVARATEVQAPDTPLEWFGLRSYDPTILRSYDRYEIGMYLRDVVRYGSEHVARGFGSNVVALRRFELNPEG